MINTLPTVVRLADVAPARPAQRPDKVVRLWLPLTIFFLLLAPFALLLIPLLYLVPRRPYWPNPTALVMGAGGVLLSLGGTEVDIQSRAAVVRIKIV